MKTKSNNWLKSGFALLGVMILTSMLAMLAMPARAQESMKSLGFAADNKTTTLNTALNATNQPYLTGPTNAQGTTYAAVTTTNSGTTTVTVWGTPFSVATWGNTPVMLELEVSQLTNTVATVGTNGYDTETLDLSPDSGLPQYWLTNQVSITTLFLGTSTNVSTAMFPVQNGTNIFTGFRWARWGQHTSAATNSCSTVQQFQALTFK